MSVKIRVGDDFIQFNKEATMWLGVWMDVYLMLKEHHRQCMKKAWAAEVRLRTLTMIYRLVPESVRAVPIACIQAVTQDGSKLWWDPKEVGRHGDLQP